MSDLSRSVERDSVQRAPSIMYVDEGSGSTHSPVSTGYNKLGSPQNYSYKQTQNSTRRESEQCTCLPLQGLGLYELAQVLDYLLLTMYILVGDHTFSNR